MSYISNQQLLRSVEALSAAKVHPFFGITYLVCKRLNLPVGQSDELKLDAENKEHLKKHHALDVNSSHFFQPFKSVKTWVKSNYSSTGLQAINTQTFESAFIHNRGSSNWGWVNNYVEVLSDKLTTLRAPKLPLFDLAVWLYKFEEFPDNISLIDLASKITSEFHISELELDELFDQKIPKLEISNVFTTEPISTEEFISNFADPPDAIPFTKGFLASIELKNIGPSKELNLFPGERLTIVTGDNGLGKSFLLDCSWWALTGNWPGQPAHPKDRNSKMKPSISFSIRGKSGKQQKQVSNFNWKTNHWPVPQKQSARAGITIFAKVDGSFSIWDPIRQNIHNPSSTYNKVSSFTGTEIWDGKPGEIEGLVRDWVSWQNKPNRKLFQKIENIVKHLAPPDLGEMTIGEPTRVPGDPREIPIIEHSYGSIPVTHCSAGVRRVLTLSYLIVWAWNEHCIAAEQTNSPKHDKMVFLIDELEAHLHPKWQRTILPALMKIGPMLDDDLQFQTIAATHSPLIMASAEGLFNDETDALYHLDLTNSGEVVLEELDFIDHGDVSSWLTSRVFEMKHARSIDAENAIEQAKLLQLSDDIGHDELKKISEELVKNLPSDDKFWPRWLYFAEQHGLKL